MAFSHHLLSSGFAGPFACPWTLVVAGMLGSFLGKRGSGGRKKEAAV